MSNTELQQEAWFRGNLAWKMHKAQKVINDTFKQSKGQLFVGNCSRQFGKSFWAVCKAVEQAIKHPNSQIRYGAPFQSDLTDFIIPAFDKVMSDCPEAIKGVYKTKGSHYAFPNGSKIKLVGLDKNPDGLRGNTLDLIILDECGFVSDLDYLYKSIIIPATTHRPNAKIILISTPPSTPAHPFVDYCQRANLEGSYAVFTIYDNPMVDTLTIDRLMKESGGSESTTWKREYLCQFILDDDLALVKEWKDEFATEIPKDEFYIYYHKLVGMDLGRKDHTALVFGYYDFKKAALVIEDELTMIGAQWTNLTLKDETVAKELALWGEQKTFRRVSDNNEPNMLVDLSSTHNISFMPVKKDASLEQMVNRVREWVKDGRIIIHPRCKMLLGCLKYGIWDKNRKGFARSKVYGHFDHFAALMYLLIHTPSHSNPIPAGHGFENHKAWLGNIKEKQGSSENARTVARALLPKRKPII